MPGKTCPCVLSLVCLVGKMYEFHLKCTRCHLTTRIVSYVAVRVPCPPRNINDTYVCTYCSGENPFQYNLTTEEGVASFRKELKWRKKQHAKRM